MVMDQTLNWGRDESCLERAIKSGKISLAPAGANFCHLQFHYICFLCYFLMRDISMSVQYLLEIGA